MNERILTREQINDFSDYLYREEKSSATREKYLRDVRAFCAYAGGESVAKDLVLAWKKYLIDTGYAVRSINSMLASVNSLLSFLGWGDCKVKNLRLQRQTYCAEEKELTKVEYFACWRHPRKTSSSIWCCKPSAVRASGCQNCGISQWSLCGMGRSR